MHNTSIFKDGIEQIEDGDHTALENAGSFGSRVMWRRLTDSSPTLSLFLAKNYKSLSPPHKIVNPSTHEILPLSSMFFQLSHQTCCLFSFHVYRFPMHTHLTYITCLHLSHRPNFFLSLSRSLFLSVSLGLSPTLSSTYIQSFLPYLLHLQKLSLHVSFTDWDMSKCCFYNGWCRVMVVLVASYKIITLKCIYILIWLGLCEFEHVVKYYRPCIHLGIR